MEFMKPPKSGKEKRTEKWKGIAEALRAAPREWGFVGTFSPGVAAQIRRGEYPAFINEGDHRSQQVQMKQDWEVTTRGNVETTPDGKERRLSDIYIRFVG